MSDNNANEGKQKQDDCNVGSVTEAHDAISSASTAERDGVTPIGSANTPSDAPYLYAGMNDDAFHTTLVGFVEQAMQQTSDLGLTLYCRILPGLQDAQRRFDEHTDDPEYRLDGCAGIEQYISKLGLKPATVRKWRQREKERMFLQSLKLLPGMRKKCKQCGQEQGHTAACPKNAAEPLRHPRPRRKRRYSPSSAFAWPKLWSVLRCSRSPSESRRSSAWRKRSARQRRAAPTSMSSSKSRPLPNRHRLRAAR
jgi:hypothetical protein